MSQGGPGLPNMGIYLSKWFTKEHDGYRAEVPTLDYHIPVSDAQMERDSFYSIVHWPIPTTWTTTVFQPNTWDTHIRQFGAPATQMGPLTLGSQRFTWHLEGYNNTVESRNHDTAHRQIDMSLNACQAAQWSEENRRRAQARKIIAKITRNRTLQLGTGNLNPDYQRDGTLDAWDSSSDTADEEDDKTPACARWCEIRHYLFNTRSPLELAWDSMTFEIPEWTLYRYIQARGGLALTPDEWHEFLVFANYREQLFQYVIDVIFLFLHTNSNVADIAPNLGLAS